MPPLTSTTTQPRIDFAEQLRKNWVIIAFIVSLIVAWTNIQSSLATQEKEISDMKVTQVALELKIDSYQRQVSDISGDIKAIKESLSYIKDKVK